MSVLQFPMERARPTGRPSLRQVVIDCGMNALSWVRFMGQMEEHHGMPPMSDAEQAYWFEQAMEMNGGWQALQAYLRGQR